SVKIDINRPRATARNSLCIICVPFVSCLRLNLDVFHLILQFIEAIWAASSADSAEAAAARISDSRSSRRSRADDTLSDACVAESAAVVAACSADLAAYSVDCICPSRSLILLYAYSAFSEASTAK